jgi:predicted RNA-binding protein YlqC (UPF0109 family)
MKLSEAFPSNYLKASDVGDDPIVLTIDRVEMVELADGARKPCVYFQEQDKGLILNKVNGNTIAAVYGDDTDDWSGQKVQLMSVPVEFNGRMVDAIRTRVRQAKPAAKPQSNVRSGTASYGEAKGRAPVANNLSDDLDDTIPF